ncbi:hypothetical protein N7475_007749, partial [Penicillium sp. IBT 31633x]
NETLAPFLMLAASAIATPVASTSFLENFHLESIGATNQEHNNLYVYGYHTGAGLNDAVLTKDGVVASGDNKFTCQGSNGFSVKGSNFMWSEVSGFGGWLVYDWYHNAPQLFYLNRDYNATIPSSCSKIQLKAEYINKL